jgi:hypothetical protein
MARAASSPWDGMFPSSSEYQTWEGSIAVSHASSSSSNAAMDLRTISTFSSDIAHPVSLLPQPGGFKRLFRMAWTLAREGAGYPPAYRLTLDAGA